MEPVEKIEKLVRKFFAAEKSRIAAGADFDKRVCDDALAAYEKSMITKPISAKPNIWRIIMKSPITKLAAAVVIIVVLLVGTYWFGGSIDGTSAALGKVIEKVEQIQNCSYELKCRIKGMPKMSEVMEGQVQAYCSGIYGYRFDARLASDGNTVEFVTYVLPAEKRIINITPVMKKYAVWDLGDKYADQWQQDPKKIIKETLEQCISGNSTRIGRKNISGVETEGFETANPEGMKVTDPHSKGITFDKALTRIWVDVQTDLPVLLEKDCWTTDGSAYMNITYNFKWDIELDRSVFEPNILADYVLEKSR